MTERLLIKHKQTVRGSPDSKCRRERVFALYVCECLCHLAKLADYCQLSPHTLRAVELSNRCTGEGGSLLFPCMPGNHLLRVERYMG